MQEMTGQADTPELDQLYRDFDANNMAPLWTQRDDLMPMAPSPAAVPHVWRWKTLFDIAERSGELVPVGRGGERRAIGLANPGLPGTAYVDADPVVRDPVPRRLRDGARAPAQPERVPLRRRGRGRVDRRQRRPRAR